MNKVFYIIYFSLFFAQAQTKFCLKNYHSNEPVSYANISLDKNMYTNSDSIGVFYIEENKLKQEVKISCLGYKSKKLKLEKTDTIIFLEEDITILDEIVITEIKNTKIKKLKFGKAKKGNVAIAARIDDNIAHVGKYFKNELEGNELISEIKFHTSCSKPNSTMAVLFYTADENGKPIKIINNENIIVNIEKGHHITEVDIKPFNIIFPKNGVVVVLQYLLLDQNKHFGERNTNWYYYEPSIGASTVSEYDNTWFNNDEIWKKSSNYSLNIELVIEN